MGRTREKIWKGLKGKGGKDLNRERGQRILRRNREKISAGGKRLSWERAGKDLNKERGAKILGRKRGKIAEEKRP